MPYISLAWFVLAAAFAIQFTFAGIHFSFGVFLKPIAGAFDWSRGATSFAFTFAWWVSAPAGIILGWLSDRIGPRKVLLIGASLFTLGIFLSGWVENLWQLYLFFGAMAGFGRAAARGPLLSAVFQHFTKRKGLAVGITLSGTGIGTLFFPFLARYVMSVSDWRTAFFVLGAVAALLVFPSAFVVRRPHNEVDDGVVQGKAASTSKVIDLDEVLAVPAEGWTLPAVLRHRVFWLFMVMGFFCCISHSLPLAHIVAYATDRGIAEIPAAGLLGLIGLTAAVGRLVWGMTADRITARKTVFCCIVIQTVLIFWLAFAEKMWSLTLFSVLYGLSYGGVLPLYAVVTRELFGIRQFGSIYGMHSFGTTIAMGTGPILGGFVFDYVGDYFSALITSGILGLVAISLAFHLAFLKGPHRPAEERVSEDRLSPASVPA
ncbi:MAG: MFS transporter [Candidatus Binatia bacterium]|jgi:MFS family permease|nr:MFS transporter [Candidatus Binatia bacterium]